MKVLLFLACLASLILGCGAPASAAKPAAEGDAALVGELGVVPIYVTDIDRALAYYRDAVGLEVVVDATFPLDSDPTRTYRWVMVGPRGGQTKVVLYGNDQPAWRQDRVGQWTGYGFVTKDVDAAYATLKARGVTFDDEPKTASWGGREVILRDPDGNTLALAQPPRTPE